MGSGVVYLHNGILSGGDNTFYYSGKYELDQDRIAATATIKRHTSIPGSRSIFVTETADVKLKGSTSIDGQINAFGETLHSAIRFEVGPQWLAA